MADKKAYHPDSVHTIRFREQYHTYIDNRGTRYVSGTSFIKPFFPKFDAVAVSIKCAAGNNPLYKGRDPKEIREEWSNEGRRGSSEGDNVHLYAEGVVSGWDFIKLPLPISDRCKLLFLQVNKIAGWLLSRFKFIGAEVIVFSPEMGVAGMVDIVFLDLKTNEIIILDWKTNKEISTENIYQNAFNPIDHLQDTAKSKYSLQLSLYRYIMEKENYFPNASGFRQALIHLTPYAAIPMKLEYYDFEIKRMLKYNETH